MKMLKNLLIRIRDFIIFFQQEFLDQLSAKRKTRILTEKEVRNHFPEYDIQLLELVREEYPDCETLNQKNHKYVVFIDIDYDVDWIACGKYETDEKEQLTALSNASSLDAYPSKQFSKAHQLAFKRLIAQSIVCALDGNIPCCEQKQKEAFTYYQKRDIELSRSWRVYIASFIYLLFIILLLLTYQSYPEYSPWYIASCFSLVGSYLSILLQSSRLKLDSSSGKKLHIIEIAGRCIMSVICGVIANIIVHTPLAPSIVQEANNTFYLHALFFIAAGLLDGFIPSFVSKSFHQRNNQQHEQNSITH